MEKEKHTKKHSLSRAVIYGLIVAIVLYIPIAMFVGDDEWQIVLGWACNPLLLFLPGFIGGFIAGKKDPKRPILASFLVGILIFIITCILLRISHVLCERALRSCDDADALGVVSIMSFVNIGVCMVGGLAVVWKRNLFKNNK